MSNHWKKFLRMLVAIILTILDLMDGPSDQKIAHAVKTKLHTLEDEQHTNS